MDPMEQFAMAVTSVVNLVIIGLGDCPSAETELLTTVVQPFVARLSSSTRGRTVKLLTPTEFMKVAPLIKWNV